MNRFRITRGTEKRTLQDALAAHLTLSRNAAKRLIDARGVFVNGRRIWIAHHAVNTGDEIEVAGLPEKAGGARASGAAPRPAAVAVLFRDARYAVVDKPAGILANGADSLETRLQAEWNLPALRAVHRLDRDTSGCLLFACDQEARDKAIEVFEEKTVLKLYHAIAAGRVHGPTDTLNKSLDNLPAVTHLRVLDANDTASHLQIKLETGRTHQIRRHLSAIHHPVLGDRQYGLDAKLPDAFREIPRQMLHAERLAMPHPFTSALLVARAPLPRDFRDWLRRLTLS
ncbi:MAG: RluA family pseudouridine synthase [bacterium]